MYQSFGWSPGAYPPDGVFWDPEADAAFEATLRAGLRPGIPITHHDHHVNSPEFGRIVAESLLEIMPA